MTEQKTPLDHVLDLIVYLPVGVALSARDELPRLVEKGRQRVSNEVTMARAVGQFVVAQGQKEAEKAVRAATQRWASPGPRTAPSAPAPAPAAAPTGSGAPSSNGSSSPPARHSPAGPAPDAGNLAIPGYDTLSASQVVQRLAGLVPAELEAVRAYEAATRGRRTILSKVEQLQSGGSSG